MSILSTIFSKIFPSSHPAHPEGSATATATATPTAAPAPAGAAPSATATLSEVDVAKVLNDLAARSAQKLNWKTSIVDLMTLLELDSSLAARKALANELGYTGDTSDSASMNIWLHRQVMGKLAANGGKVPAELKD
jgi:hypothetical protein